MKITIPSLERGDKIAYVLDDESNYNSGVKLSNRLMQFDTYGDGLCQHGPAYPVAPNQILDAMQSVAVFVADDANMTYEVLQKFWYDLHGEIQGVSKETALFLLSIKVKEGKRQFYTMDDGMKVSTNPKLQYDKRWHEVWSGADGTFLSAMELYLRTFDYLHNDFLWTFATAMSIAEAGESNWELYNYKPIEDVIGTDNATIRDVQHAVQVVRDVIAHRQELSNLKEWTRRIAERIENRKKEAVAA